MTSFINDEKTGRTYWLEDGRFSSAPTQLDNQPDLEQIDYLSDWEIWNLSQKTLLISSA